MCKLSYKRSFDCYLETFNAICTINGLKNPMYVESNAASDFPRAMMNQAKTVCFIRSGMHFHRTEQDLIDEISNTPGVLSHNLFGKQKCHFIENGENFEMTYTGPAKGFDGTVSV
ncbi:hypothetical protein L3Y34_014007 [Caenorhabditis briggsae]|uniref:Uncharacterized protein n=1 Tax=Caenorhabditis briggsae TaxID=6238 RepID=A0AAE9DRF9_CAEBR|nr:hypothetical protein L3Y34_014007 [Caenorhabditis briggsae]